jgi:hypothetical protein
MIICPCGSTNVKNVIDNTYKCLTCKLWFKIEPKRENFVPYDINPNGPKIKDEERPVI